MVINKRGEFFFRNNILIFHNKIKRDYLLTLLNR